MTTRRRSGARPAARRHRRQGPLHQGARSGDGRRPRRPRRPFAEGRADGHARRVRAGGRSPRAKTRATRSCRIIISTSREPAGRRAHRHVEPAPRSAVARARSRCCRSCRCAATSTRACASSTKGNTTRSSSPRRVCAAWASPAGSHRISIRTRACPRSGRARWRSNAAPIAPTSSQALAPLADRDTTLATTAERAFSRALSGSCHTPLAAHAVFAHGELWLRGLLASRDGAEVLRGDRRSPCDDPKAADALGRALATEFLARGAARLVAA